MSTEHGARWFARLIAAACVLAASSCALAVSFDDYGTDRLPVDQVVRPAEAGPSENDAAPRPRHAIGGSVGGLLGPKVTLRLGDARLEVGDGPFAFPEIVEEGAAWAVTVEAEALGHTCIVQRGAGTMGTTDVKDVSVSCPAKEALLASLVVSAGPLAPAFSPATLAYTTRIQSSLLFGGPTTTVTATTSQAQATLTVRGVGAGSGIATAPFALTSGSNPFDVVVTSADGASKTAYVAKVDVDVLDYLKASNARATSAFGRAVAMSGDTLVVGAPTESSGSTGIGGDPNDVSAPSAGAVYVFVKKSGGWSQQAYVKASNARANARFGASVAIDGDTMIAGSPGERSSAVGIDGDQTDTSLAGAGAAYVFVRAGGIWTQQAYLKPSNTRANFAFGSSVAVAGDTIAVGAPNETGISTGVNGNDTNLGPLPDKGAVYAFRRTGATLAQEAYLKFHATQGGAIMFGAAIALSGSTLVVGGPSEASDRTGINPPVGPPRPQSGAAWAFVRSAAGSWSQQAYIKASTNTANARFGAAVAISLDRVLIGAPGEPSNSSGLNGNQTDTSAPSAGAAYLFERTGTAWAQKAYVKPSNTRASAQFGFALAIDGSTFAVGSVNESSHATNLGGDQADTSTAGAGAVYVFRPSGTSLAQVAYVKASNTRAGTRFGCSVALTSDALAVGSEGESSSATGINGNQVDTTAPSAGAVYAY
jgi:hypothetical protein